MRKVVALAGLFIMTLAVGQAHAQNKADVAKPAKPKVYALVAAVGAQFTYFTQVQQTGTSMLPIRQYTVTVQRNTLNRYVVQALDTTFAGMEPDSTRVLLSLPPATMDAAPIDERENVAISQVIALLKNDPDRQNWDSIVVATPAYKSYEFNGANGHFAGFGVFYQPLETQKLLHASGSEFTAELDFLSSENTIGPNNRRVVSTIYTAPFSAIEIWVLDPKTLAVVDRQTRFDQVKLFDPKSDSVHLNNNISRDVLASNLISLVQRSITAAVTHADISKIPVVDVGEVKELKPESGKK